MLHAFQMLCPGCVQHGLPQAQKIHAFFEQTEVAVIGLHAVFEHHAAMTPVALRAFVHEYRIAFPVGVDSAGTDGPVPQTMQAYGLRGTPSLLLIDRQGRLRRHSFGADEDLAVGASARPSYADEARLVHRQPALNQSRRATGLIKDANGAGYALQGGIIAA